MALKVCRGLKLRYDNNCDGDGCCGGDNDDDDDDDDCFDDGKASPSKESIKRP